ncbi:MAG: hypothetical protein JJU00_01245 [Opitutales bacterium]|nr:hypothetical protein [Opitutales bacterium]
MKIDPSRDAGEVLSEILDQAKAQLEDLRRRTEADELAPEEARKAFNRSKVIYDLAQYLARQYTAMVREHMADRPTPPGTPGSLKDLPPDLIATIHDLAVNERLDVKAIQARLEAPEAEGGCGRGFIPEEEISAAVVGYASDQVRLAASLPALFQLFDDLLSNEHER